MSNSVVDSDLVKFILDLTKAVLDFLNTPVGNFITQTVLLTGVLWGGTGLIHAMQIIPAFLSKITAGITTAGAAMSISAPHLALIAAGISLLLLLSPKIVDWIKKASDETYKYESSLEQLNNRLEENKTKLEDLNSIPEKNRTDEIQAEIDALEEENKVLRENIALQEQKLGGAKFQDKVDSTTGDVSGYYVKRLPSNSFSPDSDSLNTFTEWGLIQTAEEALNKLIEVGLITQSQVDVILEDTSKTAEDALKELGFTLQKGSETLTGQLYYEESLSKFKSLVEDFQKNGKLSPDFVGSYDEYRKVLLDLLESAEEVNENELPEWFKQLRRTMTGIPDVSQEIADSYYNVKDTLKDLNDGMQINQLQYEQLIEQFPDLASALEETANGWKANISELEKFDMSILEVSDSYQKLISGMTISKSEIDQLLKVYPQLTNLVKKNNDGYYLEIEALLNSAQAGNEWASNMVRSQSGATKETIRLTKKRVEALESELAAMSGTSADFGKVWKEYQQVSKQLAVLENLYKSAGGKPINFTPIDVSFGGGGGSSSSSSASSAKDKDPSSSASSAKDKDPLAEQNKLFEQQIALLEHKLFLMQKEGATEDAQIDQMRQIQAELERQKQWYYSQGLTQNSKYIQDLEKQWWEYEDKIKDLYKEQANIYELLFSTVANKAQDEIDALNSKKEELQKQNEELQKQIELEEKLDALARAKQNKVLVFKDGKFQYTSNIDEVSQAQSELDKIKQEQALDSQLEAIDKEIDYWEKYKNSWGSVVSDFKEKQDELLIEQKLGIKLEGANWQTRLDNLQVYINKYNELLVKAGNPSVNYTARSISTTGLKSVPQLMNYSENFSARTSTLPSSIIKNIPQGIESMSKVIGITIQNFNPSLPNVTDGANFVDYLVNNLWGETLRFAKI